MNRWNKILAGGIFLLLILFISFIQSGGFAQGNYSPKASPTDSILAFLTRQISRYNTELNINGLSDEARIEIEARLEPLETEAAQREYHLVHIDDTVRTKSTEISKLTLTPYVKPAQPTPTVPDGLIHEFFNPKYKEAHFTTLWLANTDKGSIKYLAGNLIEDPLQGVLYIEKEDRWTYERYLTPDKDGSLRITGVENGLVNLTTENGIDYIFDRDKKTFIRESE